jgi:hypothetical protein
MDFAEILAAVKRRVLGPETEVINVDPPAPRLRPELAQNFTPDQLAYSRENGGLWDSTPPTYSESDREGRRAQIAAVLAGGGDPTALLTQPGPDARPAPTRMAAPVQMPDESWRGRSNEENIQRANDALARAKAARSPNADLSRADLDAKVQQVLGPKDTWKTPSPTPEGMARYNDLLAAAKKASVSAPEQDWEVSVGHIPPVPVGPISIEKRVPMATRQADASPEKKAQAAPGGGALGASPQAAVMQMAMAAIPSPEVRALLAKRMGLAMDGDAELRAAQAKEERLGALAGLQRQLGQAASTLAGERYDDSSAAANERAAGAGTRAVQAQRQQQDANARGALDITAQMERERAARAGEGMDERRLAEGERHNRESEKIDWFQARTQREKSRKEGATADKEVQKLAKEVGGNVAIGAQKLAEIDAALRAQGVHGIDDLKTDTNLSGVGGFTNTVTRLTGNALLTQKGADLRNSTLGLAATIKYLRTGKTATKQEAEEIAQEFGLAPGSSEEDFRKGVQRMRDEFVARARQSEAGFSPGAVNTFESRGGTTARKLGEIGKDEPSIRKSVGGKTYEKRDGKWYEVR